jgi:hypothetical protein
MSRSERHGYFFQHRKNTVLDFLGSPFKMRRSEETVTSVMDRAVAGSTPVDGFGDGSSIGRALKLLSQFSRRTFL